MLNKISTSKKKAAITIEVTLSVALSILVLFLALGLFSDNLATMAANSGIQNLFNRSNQTAKTYYSHQKQDPTKTAVNMNTSQVLVQIAGSQGGTNDTKPTLAQYLKQAQDTIDKYNKTPPADQSQREDLARAELAKFIANGGISTDDVNTCKGSKIVVLQVSANNYIASTDYGTPNVKTLTVSASSNTDQLSKIGNAFDTSNTFKNK